MIKMNELKALLGAGITIAVLIVVLTVSSLIVGDLQGETDSDDYWQSISVTTEANVSSLANTSIITLDRNTGKDCFAELIPSTFYVWNSTNNLTSSTTAGINTASILSNGTITLDYVNTSSEAPLAAETTGIPSWFLGANSTGTWYFNYTYYDKCIHAYNITDEGGTSIFELSDWLPLAALVIASGIVVGVVVSSMGGTA